MKKESKQTSKNSEGGFLKLISCHASIKVRITDIKFSTHELCHLVAMLILKRKGKEKVNEVSLEMS